MSAKRDGAAILGLGAAACAVCCAGPIIGFLAAIGLGTSVGFALFGTIALVVGALAAVIVVGRRRRHDNTVRSEVAGLTRGVLPPPVRTRYHP